MKGHIGAVMTMASGAVISLSTKQKVNAHSSTEAQLVAVDDVMAKILWTNKFIEWQGSEVKLNILYQDNTSMMKLEMNGKTGEKDNTFWFSWEERSDNWILSHWWNDGRFLHEIIGW